jgi:hypothetical protein
MADERDYIDQCQSMFRINSGRDATPDELAVEFARLPLRQRTIDLDRIEAGFANDESLTLNEAAKQLEKQAVRTALHEMHRNLRAVDR